MQYNNCYVSAWIKSETKIYFIPINLNFLIIYDEQKNKTNTFVIEKENFYQNNLYSKCLKYKDKIIFIPAHAKHFLFFDINTHEMEYINIPKSKREHPEYGYFSGGIIKNDSLYAVGYMYPGIVKIDLISQAIMVIDINTQKIKQLGYSFAVCNNRDIVLASKKGTMLEFCIDDSCVQITDYSKFCFNGITGYKEILWTIDNGKKCIIECDRKTKNTSIIYLQEYALYLESATYGFIEYVEGVLFLFPNKNAPIITYNISEKKFSLIWVNIFDKIGFSVIAVNVDKEKVYVADYDKKMTYQINSKDYSMYEYEIPMNKMKIINTLANMEKVPMREDFIKLEEFIVYVVNLKIERQKNGKR